mgnify:FL=1
MQRIGFLLVLLLILGACRETFDPEISIQDSSILVVEGYLDSEGKASELKLSQTVNLGADTTFQPVLGAVIEVIAESGQSYPLIEQELGIYIFEHDVPETQTYQMVIRLPNGQLFESLPMQPLITPEILDGGFIRDEDGVEIFVSTQGDAQADDFLWTFEETWIYRPRIRTAYIYDEDLGTVRNRTEADQNSLCYKNQQSPDILLETSSRFQDQVVFQKTITEIPQGNERIMDRYSILVSQKAIDQEASKFWEILRKNTEDIGSIFSPLPSLIGGNFRSLTDESTPIIGYVSMGVVRQKRIYVDIRDVGTWGYSDPTFGDCFIAEEIVFIPDYAKEFGDGSVVPVRGLMVGTTIVGYYPAPRRCVDCTLYATRGVPDYWEEYED